MTNSTIKIMFKISASVYVMLVAILAVVRVLDGISTEDFKDITIKVGIVFVILLAATWAVTLIQGPGDKKK